MPPGGGGAKRKRGGDHINNENNSSRPSPHRPEELPLARQQQNNLNNSPSSPSNGPTTRGGRSSSHANITTNTNDNANTNTDTKAPTPAPAAPSAPSAQPPQEPRPPHLIPNYRYTVLTQERLDAWQASGRDEVVAQGIKGYKENSYNDLGAVFQELIRAGLDGRLTSTEAGKVVGDVLAGHTGDVDTGIDGPAYFLDTISVLSSAYEQDMTNPNLKPFMIATGVSPALMREILDDSMLLALQLVRPTFSKQFIRKQTGILYKQSNYNLLREESEGYSKLITELFTVSDNELPSAEVVRDTYENMKAMVGAFDLDPARVLDVTLDIFASLLVKHYRFFVKLLRCSSWWPSYQSFDELPTEGQRFSSLPAWALPDHSNWMLSNQERDVLAALKDERDVEFWARARQVGIKAFFEIGGRRVIQGPELEAYLDATIDSSDVRAAETAKWIKETKTLPPQGNATAAQLLGFKLRFYASDARDSHDTLPVNLIYLAALLIKIGFISLRDLYPHLYPSDDDMAAVKEKQTKEKQERDAAKRPGGGQLNALARAGALSDDTVPAATNRLRDHHERPTGPLKPEPKPSTTTNDPAAPKADEDDKEHLPEPADQKVQLLRSLLCIGAIPEAMYLLGRFPWMVDLFPDIPEHINRILHYSISKVHDPICPLHDRDGIRDPLKTPSPDQTGSPKGDLRLTTTVSPKSLRWAQLDRKDTGDGIDYRFYWDDWTDNIPLCQNVDDIFTLCSTFLNLVGVKIGQDISLLTKLSRIGRHSLTEDDSDANRSRWVDLCKRLLCPALSLTRSNPGVVNEIFELLKMFDTKTRYSIYSEWFVGPTSRVPDVQDVFNLSRAEIKDVLKRISKTNTKQMARTLAKVACASPGVVFAVVLNQIESYDNLIDVVVECGRYFTFMGYDVLTWSLLSALGRAGRSRIGEDGISTSGWLKVLSAFTGRVFKRYSVMNTLPILQYVLHQLSKGSFTDLRVLREMVTSMGGVIPDIDFTDSQIQAMAGGELLQSQTLKLLQDKRHECKVSAKRLVKTLLDHGLVGPFLVAIAQERQNCISQSEKKPLKVIGENFDEIQIILNQFLDMVRSNIPAKEFDSTVPGIVSLISEFQLNPSISFMIHRKSLTAAIDEHAASEKQAKEKSGDSTSAAAGVDVEMAEASETIEDTNEASAPEADADEKTKAQNDDLTNDAGSPEKENIQTQPSAADEEPPWHPALQRLIEEMEPLLSKKFESSMSIPFFVTFWQLSLHDMVAPYQSYEEEIKRHNDRIHHINMDKSDNSAAGQRKKESEKKAINELLDRVREEMKTQLTSYQLTRKRLMKEKSFWFKGFHGKWTRLNTTLLQDCFLPRLLLSPLDAYFAFRMLFFLHSSGATEFLTMHFIDTLFNEKTLTNLIYQCTAREAENLGRFMNELLKELSIWHADKASFEKRAYGPNKDLPGFAQSHPQGGPPGNFLPYEHFRQLLFKWHRNLFEALKNCFNTWEYMHIKNAIVVLRSISHYFPAIDTTGEKLYTSIGTISSVMKGTHPDLWVLANSLMANLKGRKKFWVTPQYFCPDIKGQKGGNGGTQGASAQPPKSSGDASKGEISKSKLLDATVPSFVPKPVADTKTAVAGMEDGEVEDGSFSEAPARAAGRGETKLASDGASKQTAKKQSKTPTVNASTAPADITRSTPAEASKPASTAPLNRATHALPNRPEVQPPMRTRYAEKRNDRLQPPPHERPDSRQGRDTAKATRATDLMQQKLDDRRAPSPGRLDPTGQVERSSRPSSRGAEPADSHRTTQEPAVPPLRGPPRSNPPRYREPEGHAPPSRASNLRGRADASGPPHQPNNAPYDGPRDRPDSSINPERAALIESRTDEPRGIQSQRGSRPHSPSRRGDSRDHGIPRSDNTPRDQRSESMRHPPYDNRGSFRQDYPADGHYPNEPRDNRAPYNSSSSRDRDGRPLRPPPSSQDYPPRPSRHDPNYGRLNADPGPPPSPSQSQSRAYERSSGPTPERDSRHHRGSSPTPHHSGLRQNRERGSRQSETSMTIESRDSRAHGSPAPDPVGMHPDRARMVESQGPPATMPPARQQRQDQTSPATATPPVGPRTAGSRQSTSNPSYGTPTGPANSRPDRREKNEAAPTRTPGNPPETSIRGRAARASLDVNSKNQMGAGSSVESTIAPPNGTNSNTRRRVAPPPPQDMQRDERRDGGRRNEREPAVASNTPRGREAGRDLMDPSHPSAAAPDRNGAAPPSYDNARNHRSSGRHQNEAKDAHGEPRGEYIIRGQTAHNDKGRDRERERSPTRQSRSDRQYRERDQLPSSNEGYRERERRDYDHAAPPKNPPAGPPPRMAPSSRRASDNNLNGSSSNPAPPQWQGGSDRRAGPPDGRRDFSGRKRGWPGDDGSGDIGSSIRAAPAQQPQQQQYGGNKRPRRSGN